jgi:acyl homoserine lactone synthase/acyl-homoserine lactone synthase
MRLIRAGNGQVDEADALRAMFVARREVFVDLLGWDVPVIARQFELDRFDDPHARYVILLDEAGRHRASARLLPTERPHLLDSLYPDLCDGDVPRGPCVFEITRFCLDRHQNGRERRAARDRLVSELAITAIVSGIHCYTGVAETPWFEQILEFGWRCQALGDPRTYGRHELAGLRIDIDEHTMDALAATGIYVPEHDVAANSLARVAA